MVNIYEISPPAKISGLSSLIVQFDYNQYIVDALKTIPTYYYHKKDKVWEFPVCYLGRLLDSLTFLDDITLKLLDTPESGEFHFGKQFNLEPLSEIEKISFKMKNTTGAKAYFVVYSPATGQYVNFDCDDKQARAYAEGCEIIDNSDEWQDITIYLTRPDGVAAGSGEIRVSLMLYGATIDANTSILIGNIYAE